MQIQRCNSDHTDFVTLVAHLDAELASRDGDDHAFYHQFNSIQNLKQTLVLYIDSSAVGCGAIKQFDDHSMEVKRMYVLPSHRGKSLATKILLALELWAKELGYKSCILETGKRQPEAIALYKKNGYATIPNYGQYVGVTNSVCFKKNLTCITNQGQ